jgi:PIN domain nuclease of toxin-antitoxin system
VIKERPTQVLVSAVTVWEVEIKRALNRIRAPDDVAGLVDESGFVGLAITFEHAREAGRLPLHHGDPFDRMLIAQARVEGLVLATADEPIAQYDVPVLDISAA